MFSYPLFEAQRMLLAAPYRYLNQSVRPLLTRRGHLHSNTDNSHILYIRMIQQQRLQLSRCNL